jgi:hypothetical protein
VNDRWLDRLDEIVEGVETPSLDDDELLRLAGQLSAALTPLRDLDAPARAHRTRLKESLHAQLAANRARVWKKWMFRSLTIAAALLLFVLLGPGLVFEFSAMGNPNNHESRSGQSWQAADFPSDTNFVIASPNDIQRGLTLLMPTHLAPNGYILALNTNAYGSRAPLTIYLLYMQHARIYESPSLPLPASVFSNTTYPLVELGYYNGILLRTPDGQNRIEWYQGGLLCDMVSSEPVASMVAMIEGLETVSW